MNIGGVSMNIQAMANANAINGTGSVADVVGTKMLAKSLDQVQQEGAAITKMMEQSVNPHIGGNFDFSV